VAAHVLIADLNRENEAAALNRLNVAFGVGAIAGPALGALAGAMGARALSVFYLGGVAQLGLAVLVARWYVPPSAHGLQAVVADGRASLLRSWLLWLLAIALLVYVGVELGLGGWAFTYARRSAGLGGMAAALLSSGFWCALTLGRLLSPLALRRLSPEALLVAAPALAAGSTAALLLGGEHPAVLVVGVLVTGFGFGPVWPVAFALAARAFPSEAGRASGVLAMVSSAGGLVLPWLQGRVLATAGPAAGIGVTFCGCVAIVLLAALVRRCVAVRG
jgi:fucose permease